MFKARDIARKHGHDTVEVLIGGWQRNELECRALPLLRRFDFVESARYYQIPRVNGSQGPLLMPGSPVDERGRYRYIPDGKPPFYLDGDVDFVAIPNRALENGVRLEDWLPEYEIDWDVVQNAFIYQDSVRVCEESFSSDNRSHFYGMPVTGDPYVIFFMGAEPANSVKSLAGHNRGALWTPEQWAELGDSLIEQHGVKIVVVGAGYDATYYEYHVEPNVEHPASWINTIAEFSIMETLEICSQAKAVVSYQSGIGIMSHYLNVPTAIWWRAEGDSIVKNGMLTFDERMASSWMYPDHKNALPMIYGRETVQDILNWAGQYL